MGSIQRNRQHQIRKLADNSLPAPRFPRASTGLTSVASNITIVSFATLASGSPLCYVRRLRWGMDLVKLLVLQECSFSFSSDSVK